MGAIILWSNIPLYYIQYFCCRLHIRSLTHKAHIPPIWMTYGVSIVRIWEKIDRVITREHCIKLLSHHGNSGPKDDSMFGMHTIESDPCRQSRGCVIWSGWQQNWYLLWTTAWVLSMAISTRQYQHARMSCITIKCCCMTKILQEHEDIMTWKTFHIAGLLWVESNGHQWIPSQRVSNADLWCFLCF